MYKILSTILVVVFFAQSCSNTVDNKKNNEEPTLDRIYNLENELFGSKDSAPDMKKANTLLELYIAYSDANPNDTITPELLFKASDISMNVGSPIKTIGLFNRILTNYPTYKNVPTIMFLKGFVYEDQLQDYTNARNSYMQFLEKYPNSDFADDAVISLENLGKTPEELIKEFENK